MLPVAILAGGLAKRLRPITDALPKALVPVAGRPFILHQLDYLKSQGFKQVVMCTGYRAEQIKQVVGDGAVCGLEVEYSDDGEKLIGTGGALRKALPLLGPEFFVLYGDSFLPVEFNRVEQAWHDKALPGLMTVLRNQGRWDTSNVLFESGHIIEYDKFQPRPEMQFIDYGIGVLRAEVFDRYPDSEAFDLATVYHQLAVRGLLGGFEVFERFYEIGSTRGLAETEEYFLTMETT